MALGILPIKVKHEQLLNKMELQAKKAFMNKMAKSVSGNNREPLRDSVVRFFIQDIMLNNFNREVDQLFQGLRDIL